MERKNLSNSPEILKKFYKYLLIIENYSIGTVNIYYDNIVLFFEYIKEYKNINVEIKDFDIFVILGIEEQDILSYINYLSIERENQVATKNNKLFAIKAFYKYVFFEYKKYCKNKENPTKDIKPSKKSKKEIKYLNIEEVKKVLNVFNEINSDFPMRNNMIIKLTLALGLRLNEVVNLNVSSIDFEKSTIKVFGKGSKERTLYLNDKLKNEIQDYIKIYSITKDSPLFLSERKTRISRRTVQFMIENAYRLAGLEDKNYTFHTLRHTAATLMYKKNNGDILSVMKILGHTSVQTTQIYTHIENNDVKKTLELNPILNL